METIQRRFAVLLLVVAGCAPTGSSPVQRERAPTIEQQHSGTEALLIGLDVLSDQTAWAAGTDGSYTWTTDGGAVWHTGIVPGADTLQFRDVHAVSADSVYLLSIGPGAASRIYGTTDRGATWDLLFLNDMESAFYDCFDFWDDGSGLVFSDAVDGSFPIARTEGDGVWNLLPEHERPEAQAGEGGFAASGTCLIAQGDSTALIGTGNAADARILRTTDRGSTWTSTVTPMSGGEAAGLTALAFWDAREGAAFGGDLTRPEAAQDNVIVTKDGGATWRHGAATGFPGPVYGATVVPGIGALVAVGPGGAAYSIDGADTWHVLDRQSYWSVDSAGRDAVWAVGPGGRIARIDFSTR